MKKSFLEGIATKKMEDRKMNDEFDIESFRTENLYFTEEECLSWFKASSLYENYQNTCKGWD